MKTYKGKCYCIMEESVNGVRDDITKHIARYLYDDDTIGGFIREEDARSALAKYVVAGCVNGGLSSRAVEAISNGRVYNYHVYIRHVSSINGNVFTSEYFDTEDECVHARTIKKESCRYRYAMPYEVFGNELASDCLEVPDSGDLLDNEWNNFENWQHED